MRKKAAVFALVLIIADVISYGLKHAIARPRPSDLSVAPEAQPAFPSGHTTNAFALALSAYYRKFSIALLAWDPACRFSRVYLGFHYVTDLIGGALVGITVSVIVTRAAERVDDEVTNIANTPPPPTAWHGIIRLPFVFVRSFFS